MAIGACLCEIDIDLDNLKSVMEKMHNFIEGISELTYQN